MTDILLSLETGTTLLYQVQAGLQSQLGAGPFFILSTAEDGKVIAKVGDFQWPLEKATPCLRSDDHTYTFAMSAGDTGPMFYCVILPKEATEGELDLLQSVLATTTAYSPSPAAAAAAAESEPVAAGSVPSVEGAQGQQPGDARAAPEHTNAAPRQEGTAAVLPESFKKGALFLGSRLAWAANAASAGLSAAKERAESSLTPEARAKLESAKLSTRNNLEKVGSFAKEVASDVRSGASKLVNRVADNETLANRSESVRNALGTVYKDMQKAGDSVVASVREAAARVRGSGNGQPAPYNPPAPSGPGFGPAPGHTGVPTSTVPMSVPVSTPPASGMGVHGVAAGEPVTGVPVYPAVPAQQAPHVAAPQGYPAVPQA